MKRLTTVAAALVASFAISGAAWAAECKPSKWGKDDEIGAANMVKPESVLAASKLIKKGETHPLGIVIDPNMPAFPPRKMMLQVVQPNDGLGHLGEDGMYYNCNDGKEFAALTGLTKLGIHTVPPMVARGVMIDMAKHKGVDVMKAGDVISSDDIKAAAKAQGVEIREGDVVLFHTGWTDGMLGKDPKAWVSGEPGLNNESAVYLASLNVMAVGADTWGLEAVPPAKGDKVFYGHVTFLKENGIYILETMNTGRLAKEGVHEFMFVLGQARLKGAVQMMINPVAMW